MPRERTPLRYQLYRSRARKLANARIIELQYARGFAGANPDLSRVRFEAINASALDACGSWKEPNFYWNDVVAWKAREPMAIDLAIWFDAELCGLCFANPNKSRQRIRIVRLEGRPTEPHPLKNRVATLALLVIEQYAQLLGSRYIEIQEPLKGAMPVYQQLGFSFDGEGRLVKTLENLVS